MIAAASGESMPYLPSPDLTATNLQINQFTPDQLQSLLQQHNTHIQSSAPTAQCSTATITEGGHMDSQSSSGNYFPLSSNLRFENHILTFHHQCLSTLSSSIPHGSWIIDTRATSHVCSDLSRFKETSLVSDIMVSLLNGIKVHVRHIRTIHLSDSLTLMNVLYVPTFYFNLVSVSSLLRDNKCSAHFYHDTCFIQACSQDLMIGKGELHHNMYILNSQSLIPTVSVLPFCGSLSVDGSLWHQRLGDPSLVKLRLLSGTLSLFPKDLSLDSHCTVCPIVNKSVCHFLFKKICL